MEAIVDRKIYEAGEGIGQALAEISRQLRDEINKTIDVVRQQSRAELKAAVNELRAKHAEEILQRLDRLLLISDEIDPGKLVTARQRRLPN